MRQVAEDYFWRRIKERGGRAWRGLDKHLAWLAVGSECPRMPPITGKRSRPEPEAKGLVADG